MAKKKIVTTPNPEQQFRDTYASDPAGCVFKELVALHARADMQHDMIISSNPIVAKIYELSSRLAFLESKLQKEKAE